MIHMYHIPGVTDGQAQKKQAERAQERGMTTWVHEHSRLEQCNDNCQLYEPK